MKNKLWNKKVTVVLMVFGVLEEKRLERFKIVDRAENIKRVALYRLVRKIFVKEY